jgi:hypothetical protein
MLIVSEEALKELEIMKLSDIVKEEWGELIGGIGPKNPNYAALAKKLGWEKPKVRVPAGSSKPAQAQQPAQPEQPTQPEQPAPAQQTTGIGSKQIQTAMREYEKIVKQRMPKMVKGAMKEVELEVAKAEQQGIDPRPELTDWANAFFTPASFDASYTGELSRENIEKWLTDLIAKKYYEKMVGKVPANFSAPDTRSLIQRVFNDRFSEAQEKDQKSIRASDLNLDDISPDLRPIVRKAMVRFPMERDRLSAVIRMMQQDTARQQTNINNINRLDRENDEQDIELDSDDIRLNDLEKRVDSLEKGGPQESISEGKEGKNVHMTHLEDLVLDQGYDGVVSALQYVNGVRDMLAQGGGKQKVTVKWDGAPAIIAGIDPEDGKFFVGAKNVFAKSPKLVKDKKSLDEYFKGHPIHGILRYAFANLKKLGIKNVLQGDLLFSPERPPEEVEIDGERYLSFRPNTITYAVAADSDLAKRISRAKLGIVFHTTYEGASIPEMQASFGADISGLNDVADVWVEDAYYTDVTGSATLTDQENADLARDLTAISKRLSGIDKANFDKFRTDQDLGPMFNMFMNQRVRDNQGVGDPKAFVQDFLVFYKERIDKEVAKLKTGPEGKAGQAKLEKLKQTNQFIKDNVGTLYAMFDIYSKLIDVKLKTIAKLNTIQGIGTFLKTPDGYQVTNPEGYVAIGHEGGAVKFNDRLEFNRANFMLPKEW